MFIYKNICMRALEFEDLEGMFYAKQTKNGDYLNGK